MIYRFQTISWAVGKQRKSETIRLAIPILHASNSEDAQLGAFRSLVGCCAVRSQLPFVEWDLTGTPHSAPSPARQGKAVWTVHRCSSDSRKHPVL